jgi:hypothetical protein
MEHKFFILIFSTTIFESCFILRRTERDMIKNMHIGLHVNTHTTNLNTFMLIIPCIVDQFQKIPTR